MSVKQIVSTIHYGIEEPHQHMLKVLGAVLALNTLAILIVAATGWRGRFLLWAVQAEILWLWLAMGGLALATAKHLGAIL